MTQSVKVVKSDDPTKEKTYEHACLNTVKKWNMKPENRGKRMQVPIVFQGGVLPVPKSSARAGGHGADIGS